MKCKINGCPGKTFITVNGMGLCKTCAQKFVDEQIKRNEPMAETKDNEQMIFIR
jgi:hypothetical protein